MMVPSTSARAWSASESGSVSSSSQQTVPPTRESCVCGRGAGGPQRVEVDAVPVADPDRDDTRGLELAVEVEDEGFARVALAARRSR